MPAAPGEATGTSGSSSCGPQGPPAAIEFNLGAKRLVRYYRMARSGDSDAAVLGKGGFGCVYRYALDTSFTPPSSVDLSLSLSPRDVGRHASGREVVPVNGASTSNNTHSLGKASTTLKPPSLVAVKLCRTPCSGSFDELQKTSLVDKRTRRAELQDDRRTHVRIVRGEGRIFEYLQAAHQVSEQSGDVPLVKLLANLSPTGIDARQEQHSSLSMPEDEEDGPPTRLLVFEKLIELDAEPTPRGWAKSRKPWSHERVEKMAFEVMQGLRFLHEHNVTHGDLKPSNLMLDPRTGVVKIIDLGASRRFVHLSNRERNNRRAVEQQDRQALLNGRAVPRLAPELCEGLGSLTGSPYYMAPEILIQATRYIDISGKSRSVLEDYEYDYPSFLPRDQWSIFQIGLSDLKRGWGIRADIWSWACTVQALLLKTVEEEQRPSSSTISPYDFSFSRHRHEMTEPLYQKAAGEDDVPRFHQWCRVLPLLIVGIALEPILLVAQADGCSPALRSALKASLRHQDLRPTADDLFSALQSARSSPQRTSDARLHPADGVDGSPRRQDKAGQLGQLGASEADYGSPQIRISELEGSRQTTPSLSRGTSRTSTPQHTCETIGRSASTRTPDRLNKGKVRLAACSMEMSPDRTASKSCGVDDERATSAMMLQGFELVSPPRNPKPRSTTLGDARRPATANARLPSPGTWTRSADALRAEANARQMPRSASSVRIKTSSLPRTSPMLPELGRSGGCLSTRLAGQMETATATATGAGVEWVSDAADRGGQNSRTGDGELRPPLSAGAAPLSPGGSGLDAAMRGLRNLKLSRPSLGSRRTGGETSAPHSPSWHLRGSSMPVLGRGGESRAQAQAWTTQLDGSGIGDSPQCSLGEGKAKRQSNLMATLKEKQVRLKFGTLKLKGRRQESGEDALGDCKMQRGGTDMVTGDVEVRVAQLPTDRGGEGTRREEMASPMAGHGGTRSRNTGSRSGTGTGGSADGKPSSKQLLRRLLTWSASSS